MPASKKSKGKGSKRHLYHSAKISEYRFRKVLWHYVCDHSVALTARETRLSANSVSSIFRKIRVYFAEVGLFTDYYEGQEPGEGANDNEAMEFMLLDFHLTRLKQKRGMKLTPGEPDYHFAESYWRFQFKVMMDQRPADEVYNMMLSHLLKLIRSWGPIGTKPKNIEQARLIMARQLEQRILWLERNAPEFRSEESRLELEEIRKIEIKP